MTKPCQNIQHIMAWKDRSTINAFSPVPEMPKQSMPVMFNNHRLWQCDMICHLNWHLTYIYICIYIYTHFSRNDQSSPANYSRYMPWYAKERRHSWLEGPARCCGTIAANSPLVTFSKKSVTAVSGASGFCSCWSSQPVQLYMYIICIYTCAHVCIYVWFDLYMYV